MDSDLRALLKNNRVDDMIIMHMEGDNVKCHTLKQFAHWVDDHKEIKAVLLSGTTFEESREQQANMRSAWSDACEAVSRIAKRAAEGLASYDIDEPLD
eukprot:1739799-Karenia_brevis.AAC.1